MALLHVEVHDEQVQAGLSEAAAAAETDAQRLTRQAAESEILPLTRSLTAPSRSRSSMVAETIPSGVSITTTAAGKELSIMRLLDQGGTVSTPIVPVSKKALAFGGVIVAKVSGPRTYRAKRFVERSVDERLPQFADKVERDLAQLTASRVGGTVV